MREQCDCGKPLPPRPTMGDWGRWRCRKCGQAYCQDCGAALDENNECTARAETKQ